MESKKISCKVGEADFVFETGKLAGQASGAVLARVGDTIVLATTIMSDKSQGWNRFLPAFVRLRRTSLRRGKN
jgi:polyribonucleotide nucleotidyltransferase